MPRENNFAFIDSQNLNLAIRSLGWKKGNVDAELVLHTMIQYNNFDQGVIVTGDGDFYCLVEYLVQHQKLKRLVIPNKYRYSSLLRRYNQYCSFLNGTDQKLAK